MFGLFNSKIQNVIIVKTVQCSRLLIYSNNSKTTVQSLMTLKVSYSIKNGVNCLKVSKGGKRCLFIVLSL